MNINWKLTSVLFVVLSIVEAQELIYNGISLKIGVLRQAVFRALIPMSEGPLNLRVAEELHILQPKVDSTTPFTCGTNNTRSNERPTSVHALRPGDIDIIAALGDSLVAGNGLLATNVLHVYEPNRGLSPFIGGEGDWRQYTTLPNILKEFNSGLTGYSFKDVDNPNDSQLNIAKSSTRSKDIPDMAKTLVEKMRSYSGDSNARWKMISLLVGGNDFCEEMCKQSNLDSFIDMHRTDLREAFRTLRDNLPRTIVNLALTPHLSILTRASRRSRPAICSLTQPYLCPCLFNPEYRSQREQFYETMSKWQTAQTEVANEPEFDRDDFTIVVQPFISNYSLVKTRTGLTDYSTLSQDCFHLSQKEAARAALSLWNNLLEPVGRKSITPSELYNFKCPSLEHPYIFTRRNSADSNY